MREFLHAASRGPNPSTVFGEPIPSPLLVTSMFSRSKILELVLSDEPDATSKILSMLSEAVAQPNLKLHARSGAGTQTKTIKVPTGSWAAPPHHGKPFAGTSTGKPASKPIGKPLGKPVGKPVGKPAAGS